MWERLKACDTELQDHELRWIIENVTSPQIRREAISRVSDRINLTRIYSNNQDPALRNLVARQFVSATGKPLTFEAWSILMKNHPELIDDLFRAFVDTEPHTFELCRMLQEHPERKDQIVATLRQRPSNKLRAEAMKALSETYPEIAEMYSEAIKLDRVRVLNELKKAVDSA